MEALVKSFEDKNVFFFHTLGGDQDLPNVHFKKHYRLRYPIITDNTDRYRHIIRVRGITNVAVFGGDGVCVFNKSFMAEAEESGTGFAKVIEDALAKIDGPNLKKAAFLDSDTVYAPAVKKEGTIVRERMPSLAAGPKGELYLAYTSDASGSNDILLRSYRRGKWSKPVAVAKSKADEYAPSVIGLANGVALVAYVSNEKGRYDIHTAFVKSGKVRKRTQVSRSNDDAMAPMLCVGDRGGAWLTWYEWAKMGLLSRDREVFVARAKGTSWSRPVQISPKTVPTYEDHADPVITSDGRGGAWVAWAWDYHGTLRKKVPVEENSVFARHLDAKMQLGDILAVGFRGSGRARDYVPSITVSHDGTPWVAWDNSHKASIGYNAKGLFANALKGADFGEQVEIAAHAASLDSPRLFRQPKEGLQLVWGEEHNDGWRLMTRSIRGDGELGATQRLLVRSKQPRYPTACFDAKGNLWVAYVDRTKSAWTVVVDQPKAALK